jgi:hypothetical protein
MFRFLEKARKLPPLSKFTLKTYSPDFLLENLALGVDNIRYDVLISPAFVDITRKITARLVARHATVEKMGGDNGQISWNKQVDDYKQLYREILEDAINKSKGQREVQIEWLAQTALIKMLLEQIRVQYDHLVGRIKKAVRKAELAVHNDQGETPKLKAKLQRVLQDRNAILQRVGKEICGFWSDIETKDVTPMHEAVFGKRSSFFVDLLNSPMVHVDQLENEFFMIAEYDIVLGRRIEDPDKFGPLLFSIQRILNLIDKGDRANRDRSLEQRLAQQSLLEDETSEDRRAYHHKIDGILKDPENMDRLLNWQLTKRQIRELKKNKHHETDIGALKSRLKEQKKVLNFFYNRFYRSGLMDRIVASYEMQPEYLAYCPPLIPQQIIQYLTLPKSRKIIRNRLKRMKKIYNRNFSLRPLSKKIKAMEQMTSGKRKAYLLRFINAFSRYYRDKSNAELIGDAMERVHLATEEKVIVLSRENNTLYEFLLPHERTVEKAPIINHVVIKADVRGSTDITHQMNERGLNPASYFSLNFFDPISEILSEYGAQKIFIEGDAIILSIFERQDAPSGWYGVARACGIALNMLIIIQRYNEKSKRHCLPILELGIGISFLDKTPTFLFDGNSRIMISSAINQADRLSGCSKTGRMLFDGNKSPYNLHVFQTLSDEELAGTSDDLFERYNVNGIELSAAAFEKLSHEINLTLLKGGAVDSQNQKSNLYVGQFPTQSGRYQRIIIREAQIPMVDPLTLKTKSITSRKYYEVCTHPKIYALDKHRG